MDSTQPIEGNIRMLYSDPFSENYIVPFTIENNSDAYLNNYILIYLNEQEIPYAIKRDFLINLTYDDIDYSCEDKLGVANVNTDVKYYNLYKLFLNYPEFSNIIIPKIDFDSIDFDSIKRIHLTTNNQQISTYPKIKNDLRPILIDDDKIRGNITDCLMYYVMTGYSRINGYLIRLNHYQEKTKIPLHAKTIEDIAQNYSAEYFIPFYNYFSKTKYSDKSKFIPIEAMEMIVKHIDLAFYKIAPKVSQGRTITLVRGVNTRYSFLNEIGDKMIFENYISTSKHEEAQFGIYHYNIIVSEGIPYIDTSDFERYGDFDYNGKEKEVILPRNLIAELVEIEGMDDENFIEENAIHTILLSCAYPNQFDLDIQECNTFNLYNVAPIITGGKKNKKQKTRRIINFIK